MKEQWLKGIATGMIPKALHFHGGTETRILPLNGWNLTTMTDPIFNLYVIGPL